MFGGMVVGGLNSPATSSTTPPVSAAAATPPQDGYYFDDDGELSFSGENNNNNSNGPISSSKSLPAIAAPCASDNTSSRGSSAAETSSIATANNRKPTPPVTAATTTATVTTSLSVGSIPNKFDVLINGHRKSQQQQLHRSQHHPLGSDEAYRVLSWYLKVVAVSAGMIGSGLSYAFSITGLIVLLYSFHLLSKSVTSVLLLMLLPPSITSIYICVLWWLLRRCKRHNNNQQHNQAIPRRSNRRYQQRSSSSAAWRVWLALFLSGILLLCTVSCCVTTLYVMMTGFSNVYDSENYIIDCVGGINETSQSIALASTEVTNGLTRSLSSTQEDEGQHGDTREGETGKSEDDDEGEKEERLS